MTKNLAGITGEQLLQIVQRIERLEHDKAVVAEDVKSVYAEAKANGYDSKIIKKLVGIRKLDPNERSEQETLLDLYMQAIGMRVE